MASPEECLEAVRKLPAGQQKLILWALRDYLENGGDFKKVMELHGVLDHFKR